MAEQRALDCDQFDDTLEDRRLTRVIQQNTNLSEGEDLSYVQESSLDETFIEKSPNEPIPSSPKSEDEVLDKMRHMTDDQVQEFLERLNINEDNSSEDGVEETKNVKNNDEVKKNIVKLQKNKQTLAPPKKTTKKNIKTSQPVLSAHYVDTKQESTSTTLTSSNKGIGIAKNKKGKNTPTILDNIVATTPNQINNESKTSYNMSENVTATDSKQNKLKTAVRGIQNEVKDINIVNQPELHSNKKENEHSYGNIENTSENKVKTKDNIKKTKLVNSTNMKGKKATGKKIDINNHLKENSEVKEESIQPEKKIEDENYEDEKSENINKLTSDAARNNIENKTIRLTRSQHKNALSVLKENNEAVIKQPVAINKELPIGQTRKNKKQGTHEMVKDLPTEHDLENKVVQNPKKKLNSTKKKSAEVPIKPTSAPKTNLKSKSDQPPKDKKTRDNKGNKGRNVEVIVSKQARPKK